MDCILSDGEIMMKEYSDNNMLCDMSIIIVAQKIERYEVAAYNNLIIVAQKIHNPKIADVLFGCLKNEIESERRFAYIYEEIHCDAALDNSKRR